MVTVGKPGRSVLLLVLTMVTVGKPGRSVLLLLTVAAVCGGESAAPDCSNTLPQHKTSDPSDCTRYYVCLDGGYHTSSVKCDPSEFFDYLVGECVPLEARPECHPAASPAPPPPACHYRCAWEDEDDLTSDPYSCSSYFFCRSGQKYGPFFCPVDRPLFNGAFCERRREPRGTGEAGHEEQGAAGRWLRGKDQICCRDPCVAYCHPRSVQIQDPRDCHQFYICVEEGLASRELHGWCPQGRYMSLRSGRCVEGVAEEQGEEECSRACSEYQLALLDMVSQELWEAEEKTPWLSNLQEVEAAAESLEHRRYFDAFYNDAL